MLFSPRGLRLQRISTSIKVCRVLSMEDIWRKWSSAAPRNMLSLNKAASWGQTQFADLLWTRIYWHPGLQPASCTTARRAWSTAADGTVINLIVTSTALNIRLSQEAHKRKLSAVTWILLLREWGKQKNKSQHSLTRPALPAQGSLHWSSVTGWGTTSQRRLASNTLHSWLFSGNEAIIPHPECKKDSRITRSSMSWRCPSASPVYQLVISNHLGCLYW